MQINYKLIILSLTIILYLAIISMYWHNINLPFSNIDGPIGYLTLKEIQIL